MTAPSFGAATPIDDIVAYIDRARKRPALRDGLVDLLREQSPVHAGRSTSEAEQLRGYALASFDMTGLPPAALPFVLEELESGRNPYTVAAAAKAVRGMVVPPEGVVPLLLQAFERLSGNDDEVWFQSYARPSDTGSPPTALMEILRTLALLGPPAGAALAALEVILERNAAGFSAAVRAEIENAIKAISRPARSIAESCCGDTASAGAANIADGAPLGENLESVELQDQSGALLTFGEFFFGRPSVVTFFYTRCMNPEKCSLTIAKLARLQRRISEERLDVPVNIVGITYDPAFDLPHRLFAYGTDRGMIFDGRSRLLRTTGGIDPLRRRFDLGVGYGAVTVNRHRIELFVLDELGRTAASFTRMLWHEDQVIEALRAA